MSEFKSCVIEYTGGHLVSMNLNIVQTIYYINDIGHKAFYVSFSAVDYYTFHENKVTESSWNLLHAMMRSL